MICYIGEQEYEFNIAYKNYAELFNTMHNEWNTIVILQEYIKCNNIDHMILYFDNWHITHTSIIQTPILDPIETILTPWELEWLNTMSKNEVFELHKLANYINSSRLLETTGVYIGYLYGL